MSLITCKPTGNRNDNARVVLSKCYQRDILNPESLDITGVWLFGKLFPLDDELEPVALRKNEFVIRDSSFANHGIEEGYIIKYDPDEVYFGDYQAVELDGVIIPAFVTNERDGKCELYFEDDAYQPVTVFTDKIRFLGKLVGYRNPDEFYFRDFIEDEHEDEDYDETEY